MSRYHKQTDSTPGVIKRLGGADTAAATAAANRLKGLTPKKAAELARLNERRSDER